MLSAEMGELRKMAADKMSLWVKFLRLGNGVEDAEVGLGIAACACRPLPVAVVERRVVIDEGLPKPCFTKPPVAMEVFA